MPNSFCRSIRSLGTKKSTQRRWWYSAESDRPRSLREFPSSGGLPSIDHRFDVSSTPEQFKKLRHQKVAEISTMRGANPAFAERLKLHQQRHFDWMAEKKILQQELSVLLGQKAAVDFCRHGLEALIFNLQTSLGLEQKLDVPAPPEPEREPEPQPGTPPHPEPISSAPSSPDPGPEPASPPTPSAKVKRPLKRKGKGASASKSTDPEPDAEPEPSPEPEPTPTPSPSTEPEPAPIPSTDPSPVEPPEPEPEPEASPAPGAKGKRPLKRRGGKAAAASASSDGLIAYSYKPRHEVTPHLDCVRAVGFYQSQPILISGSDDATIRLTNLEPKAAGAKKARPPPPVQLASLRGHGGPILALAPFEVDGQQSLLSGSLDGTVAVWKLPGPLVTFYEAYGQLSHHRVAVYELHSDAVWSVDVLGDRKTAVSVGAEGAAKLWTIETGEAVLLPISEPVCCAAICDMKFAIGCQNGTVQLFEGTSSMAVVEAGHEPIRRLAATAAFVFAGSDDGQIRVVDVLAASVVGTIDGPEGGATGLCVTGDGNFVITVGNDKMLSAWRTEGFDRVEITNLLHATKYGEAALCCAASPPGSGKGYFATGGADGALQIFLKG